MLAFHIGTMWAFGFIAAAGAAGTVLFRWGRAGWRFAHGIEEVLAELRPNGGSSLRDQIDAIHDELVDHRAKSAETEAYLHRLWHERLAPAVTAVQLDVARLSGRVDDIEETVAEIAETVEEIQLNQRGGGVDGDPERRSEAG